MVRAVGATPLCVFPFIFSFCETVSLVCARAARALTFVGCDKSKQKHACACSPKVLKITSRLCASPLLGDSKPISSTYLILYESVILRFLLPALHRLFTELLYLKQPLSNVSANGTALGSLFSSTLHSVGWCCLWTAIPTFADRYIDVFGGDSGWVCPNSRSE